MTNQASAEFMLDRDENDEGAGQAGQGDLFADWMGEEDDKNARQAQEQPAARGTSQHSSEIELDSQQSKIVILKSNSNPDQVAAAEVRNSESEQEQAAAAKAGRAEEEGGSDYEEDEFEDEEPDRSMKTPTEGPESETVVETEKQELQQAIGE